MCCILFVYPLLENLAKYIFKFRRICNVCSLLRTEVNSNWLPLLNVGKILIWNWNLSTFSTYLANLSRHASSYALVVEQSCETDQPPNCLLTGRNLEQNQTQWWALAYLNQLKNSSSNPLPNIFWKCLTFPKQFLWSFFCGLRLGLHEWLSMEYQASETINSS